MGYFSQLDQDIKEAERLHRPRTDLRRQHVAQVKSELDYETSIEHSVAMSMQSLTGSVTDLCKVAGEEGRGYETVKHELTDLELTYARLGKLILALHGVTI